MEALIFGWWWRSRQSLACKSSCIFKFCVMPWKDASEPTIKYCLGRQIDVGQEFITILNFGNKLTASRWNSSGIFSKDSPHCSFARVSGVSQGVLQCPGCPGCPRCPGCPGCLRCPGCPRCLRCPLPLCVSFPSLPPCVFVSFPFPPSCVFVFFPFPPPCVFVFSLPPSLCVCFFSLPPCVFVSFPSPSSLCVCLFSLPSSLCVCLFSLPPSFCVCVCVFLCHPSLLVCLFLFPRSPPCVFVSFPSSPPCVFLSFPSFLPCVFLSLHSSPCVFLLPPLPCMFFSLLSPLCVFFPSSPCVFLSFHSSPLCVFPTPLLLCVFFPPSPCVCFSPPLCVFSPSRVSGVSGVSWGVLQCAGVPGVRGVRGVSLCFGVFRVFRCVRGVRGVRGVQFASLDLVAVFLRLTMDSSWKHLSLNGDELVISLSHAKVHVFSDSVLCLGKTHQNPQSNYAWEDSSPHYRALDTIDGEPVEFEWNISQDSPHRSSATKSKSSCRKWAYNQKITLDGLSSCRCSTTSHGDLKTMNRNANWTPTSFLLLREDFQQDNGHSSDLDQKRNGILLKIANHTENGTELQNRWCLHLQKADTQFSVLQVHCHEERSKAKEVENYQYTSVPTGIRLKLFFAQIFLLISSVFTGSLRFVWGIQSLPCKNGETCHGRTIWPIVCAKCDEDTYTFDRWSCARRCIAKIPRTSGKALTTRSCDQDLYWCRIPGNGRRRTVLHDKRHWRILTIYRISGLSWVHFAKRRRYIWPERLDSREHQNWARIGSPNQLLTR